MKKTFSLLLLCLMALTMNAQRYAVLDFEAAQGISVTQDEGVQQPQSNATTPAFIDLGLPSGTKWKNFNATGFYTYEEAVSQFGKRLPTKEQWQELKGECQWTWTRNGYKVVGPNGNSIVLPAAGYRDCYGDVNDVGSFGDYWSSTPSGSDYAWLLLFDSGDVRMDDRDRCNVLSVRLVQEGSPIAIAPQPQSNATTPAFIDLGLPSGTKWANSNETGFYTYEEAVSQFGKRLPTKEQWQELKGECQWTWTGNGYKVVGPNGNSIVLPAAGYRSCCGSVGHVGSYGSYWSSTPYGSGDAWILLFNSGDAGMNGRNRCYGSSVRLVQD